MLSFISPFDTTVLPYVRSGKLGKVCVYVGMGRGWQGMATFFFIDNLKWKLKVDDVQATF